MSDITRWQGIGDPPPPGGEGPLCDQCKMSMWVELGGGKAVDVYHPNIDRLSVDGVDIVHDLMAGTIPLHDGHAERIKVVHLLNHLSLQAARSVLRECVRVLRSGGLLFVMVTDLPFLLERLCEEGLVEHWLEGLYGTTKTDESMAHHWGYGFSELKVELESAGLVDVTHAGYYNRWEFKTTAVRP